MKQEFKIIYTFEDGYKGKTEVYLNDIKLGILTKVKFEQDIDSTFPHINLEFGVYKAEAFSKCSPSLQNNLIKYYKCITNFPIIESNILKLKKYINLKAFW